MQGRPLSEAQLGRFLRHLAISANVTASAHAVPAARSTVYAWRAADPEFAELWDDALGQATDTLEAEARRRAFHGYDELLTCKDGLIYGPDGKPVTQRRYSDSLMALLLTAYRPARFRRRTSVESAAPGGRAFGPVTMNMMIAANASASDEVGI